MKIRMRLAPHIQTFYGKTRDEEFTALDCGVIGGFSKVYTVRDKNYKEFAVKTVKSLNDVVEISSIKHEGNVLSQLQGDNIIKLIHFHDGSVYDDLPPYLILEYAEKTLQNPISKHKVYFKRFGHFSVSQILNTFLPLCSGMSIINETFVHGDIRPVNILLVEGTPKIADFGVAEPIDQRPNRSEFREHRCWEYVPPEYWQGTNSTIEMDIYCMGLVFYLLAALQYPYVVSKEGDDETAYREAHTTQVANNPSDFNDQISSDLSHIILKMIEKRPEDRFHSWNEIIELLKPMRL